jgi:hypothetical protein
MYNCIAIVHVHCCWRKPRASDIARPNGIELTRRAGFAAVPPPQRLLRLQRRRCFRAPIGAVACSEGVGSPCPRDTLK